jgi:hypothetical protein
MTETRTTRVIRRQCKQCPWKVTTDPRTIPDGYCEEKHRRLSRTIARVDEVNLDVDALRIFACHATVPGREKPCIGWLHHQLTDGNNVLLRYFVALKRISADYTLDGPQHDSFEATLPK